MILLVNQTANSKAAVGQSQHVVTTLTGLNKAGPRANACGPSNLTLGGPQGPQILRKHQSQGWELVTGFHALSPF